MKKYKKQYEVQSEVGENGKMERTLVYIGEYYRYERGGTDLKKMKWMYGGALALLSAILVGMGLINNPGSRRLEITIPYVACYLPLVYAWLGAFRIMTAPERMSYVDYDKGCLRLKKSGVGMLVFSALTLAGEFFYWSVSGAEFSLSSEWLFLAGGLLFCLILLAFLRIQRRFPCISEKKI